VMTQTKNSLGPEGPPLAYVFEEAVVDTKFGPAVISRFAFTGESERSVYDVLRENRGDDEDRTEQDEAAAWLVDHLAQQGGEANAGDAIKAATKHGFAKRTVQRARKRAGVAAVKSGMSGGWLWSIDSRRRHQGAEAAKPQPQTVAPSAPSVAPSEIEHDDCPDCGAPLDHGPPGACPALPCTRRPDGHRPGLVLIRALVLQPAALSTLWSHDEPPRRSRPAGSQDLRRARDRQAAAHSSASRHPTRRPSLPRHVQPGGRLLTSKHRRPSRCVDAAAGGCSSGHSRHHFLSNCATTVGPPYEEQTRSKK